MQAANGNIGLVRENNNLLLSLPGTKLSKVIRKHLSLARAASLEMTAH